MTRPKADRATQLRDLRISSRTLAEVRRDMGPLLEPLSLSAENVEDYLTELKKWRREEWQRYRALVKHIAIMEGEACAAKIPEPPFPEE